MTTAFALDYSANFSKNDSEAEMNSIDYSLTNISGIPFVREFLDYVCDYYTRNDGLKVSNTRAFQEDVLQATEMYLEKCDTNNKYWWGDTGDREGKKDSYSQVRHWLTPEWNLMVEMEVQPMKIKNVISMRNACRP